MGADVVYMTDPLARPDVLPGRSYKLRWPESDHAIYITLNDIVQEGAGKEPRRRPFEIFINSKNMEHYAWTLALTRMISAVFRSEEHTSELQSLMRISYAVFCLKKKNKD